MFPSLLVGWFLMTVPLAACNPGEADAPSKRSISKLRLATTTSTRDSGLMEHLLPSFEAMHHARVEVIAVGTGQALRLGERGDVDAVLVHAPEAERRFLEGGHGVRREAIMYNYFTVLGPPEDPAKLRGLPPLEALRRLQEKEASFVSRGDDSGTHKRELSLWRQAGIAPGWPAYLETGQGQAASLIIADQLQAYVLTDRGTYLKLRTKLSLKPVFGEFPELHNPYSALVVDPAKHEAINVSLAHSLLDFLRLPQTQDSIAAYRRGDEALFYPFKRPQTLPTRAGHGIPR